MARLKSEKDKWVPNSSSKKNSAAGAMLQMCLFARCKYTAVDALYAAKFLLVLHKLRTPGFSSLICYDRVSRTCSSTCCSHLSKY